LARINLWTFRLPGLSQRREDIEPNLDYELEQYASRTGNIVSFNKEARRRFMSFAISEKALWKANFRDLNAAVTRMATLASGGRIHLEIVEEEIERLESVWFTSNSNACDPNDLSGILGMETAKQLDRFDLAQLAEVIRVCRQSRTLSEAGRLLFDKSRLQKKSPNDADRLRKFLNRFGLNWEDLHQLPPS
jgi:transcriptional regulatory protein RtcR